MAECSSVTLRWPAYVHRRRRPGLSRSVSDVGSRVDGSASDQPSRVKAVTAASHDTSSTTRSTEWTEWTDGGRLASVISPARDDVMDEGEEARRRRRRSRQQQHE